MTSTGQVVIVGAGMAGFQVALALRTRGYDGSIALVGDEAAAPYSRPPLSKDLLLGKASEHELELRPHTFYAGHRIDLMLGTTAVGIDRPARQVVLRGGGTVRYDVLVLATGSRPRQLDCPGAELPGVMSLRSMDDAIALRRVLLARPRLLLVGGGFIGLEVAAAACRLGGAVTVLEQADRVMARAVSAEVSVVVSARHRREGADLRFGAEVSVIREERGALRAEMRDGAVVECDRVLVGIGGVANDELARGAGLATEGGVVVDDCLRSVTDPSIHAIGDCARFPAPYASHSLRLESVQNAHDQAKTVAASIATGTPVPYRALPWFWTQQHDLLVQMAGWPQGHDRTRRIGDPEAGGFSVEYFRQGQLVAVDSVNHGTHHMRCRKALQERFGA